MADEKQSEGGPLPHVFYMVSIDGITATFQEVTGLNAKTQVIENPPGDGAEADIKMPGLHKYGSVTLRRGLFKNDENFWNWYHAVESAATTPADVVINLENENKDNITTWTLLNAWATKAQGATVRSDSNDVVVELVEFSFAEQVMTSK